MKKKPPIKIGDAVKFPYMGVKAKGVIQSMDESYANVTTYGGGVRLIPLSDVKRLRTHDGRRRR